LSGLTQDEHERIRALVAAGRFLETARLAETLLRLRPTDPQAYSEIGLIHLRADQPQRAIAFLSNAVRLAPADAKNRFQLACALELAGRDNEALAVFRQTLALTPKDATVLARLADFLLNRGEPEEAVKLFRQASAAAPGTIGSYLHLAEAFIATGALAEAEAILNKAIQKFPESRGAHRSLATVFRQRGDFDRALPLLIRATEGNAVEAATAYYDLVNSKRIAADDQPVLLQMKAILQLPGLPRKCKIRLEFGLGKALDDLGRYDEAFRHFEEANRLTHEGRRFDKAHFGASVVRTTMAFTKEALEEQAAHGSPSELPVFIVGMPRSGTTLVERIISSHPQVAAGGELPFWNKKTATLGRNGGIDRSHLSAIGEEYQSVLRSISKTAERVTDKQPTNFIWIGLIHTIFPRARIIHCRRNPVDTCLSNYFTNFSAPIGFANDRSDLAFYYQWYERLMTHWRGVLPPGILLDVDYEHLVTEPTRAAREMIEFLGLDWDDACSRPDANRANITTASMWQARQPAYRHSLNRWRNYEPWLGDLRQLLLAEDAQSLTQPVSENPSVPAARRLQNEGRLDEALSAIQHALRSSPDDPILYNDAGAVCLLSDRVDLAVDCFERAIGLCAHFSTAYYNLGAALERQGRPSNAIQALRRATELDPGMGAAFSRLGDLLQTQGDASAASLCFRRAAELRIDPINQELEEVKLLLAERRLGEAETKLRNIIASDPANGLAHAVLGDLLGQLGRFPEARALLRRAFELDSSKIGALHNLVMLTRISRADEELLDAMSILVQQPNRTDSDRILLHFALGKAHDDLGNYEAAIQHFDAGNSVEYRRVQFDRVALVAQIDQIISAFPADRFVQSSDRGVPSELPVLVLGMPRSGTTLVEQIISSHSKVGSGGELEYWTRKGESKQEGYDLNVLARTGPEYLAILRNIAPNALRATDKNPFNFLHIGLIHLALPNARFVHCRRDPVSTCLSIYFTRFESPLPFANHRDDIVFYYRQYQRLMAHWRRVLPQGRLLEVDYETIVAEPLEMAKRMVQFADLAWEEQCAHPEKNLREIKTASLWQARQPVYQASLERWRNYELWLGGIGDLALGV
jgi:tetratricopeptide (TPR) repeat protein